ncbi:type II toxin-antitoxin system ParD family antitoxin [Bradyrhizobium japonicum]|nr:type II toxin-antitoxin system ParD family antitoxin [Bradyrhizobium japonicum]MBR0809460.1 type II toxin-antitoxin system ParD family antitoxin [Bradyrhizobium japonicum]
MRRRPCAAHAEGEGGRRQWAAVVLTEPQEELLETLVKSGRDQSVSDVLRDGLRLVEQREDGGCR